MFTAYLPLKYSATVAPRVVPRRQYALRRRCRPHAGARHRADSGRPGSREPGDAMLLDCGTITHYGARPVDLARDKGSRSLVAARAPRRFDFAKQFKDHAAYARVVLARHARLDGY